MEAVAQIFTGKNGKTIAGIIGIVILVVADKIIEHGYRLSDTAQNGVMTLEPVVSDKKNNITETVGVLSEEGFTDE